MATIHLPKVLTKITKQSTFESPASTILALIHAMIADFPALKPYLLSSSNSLTPFINIYVNQQDIRVLNKEHTPLNAADVVTFIPAMAGG